MSCFRLYAVCSEAINVFPSFHSLIHSLRYDQFVSVVAEWGKISESQDVRVGEVGGPVHVLGFTHQRSLSTIACASKQDVCQ